MIRRRIWWLRRDERGITLPMVALMMAAILIFTAFGIDLGRQMLLRRDSQADADAIALDLSRLIDGQTVGELMTTPPPTYVTEVLERSAEANGIDPALVTLRWGLYDTNPPPHGQFTVPSSSTVAEAVEVTIRDSLDYYFAPGSGSVRRLAVAGIVSTAQVGIGSVGAGIDPSTPDPSVNGSIAVQVLDAFIRAAFGASAPNGASADVLSYQGLASSDFNMGDVAGAAGFGSADEMASSTMTAGQFFNAASQVANANGDSAAAAYFAGLAANTALNQSSQMSWGNVLDASTGNGSFSDMNVNGLDLAYLGATAVDGNNLLGFTFNPGIPGVTVGNVRVAVIEKPQFAKGPVGTFAETAQVRISIDLTVAPGTLLGINAPIRIPLVIEGAQGTGTISRIDCASPRDASEVDIRADTSAARVRIGTTNNLGTTVGPVTVDAAAFLQASGISILSTLYAQLPLGFLFNQTIMATGDVSVGGGSETKTFLPFPPMPPWQRATGGVSTTIGTQLQASLRTSLAGPFGNIAATTLSNQLAFVFNDLAGKVLNPLLKLGGVTFGGADVLGFMSDDIADYEEYCGSPTLLI